MNIYLVESNIEGDDCGTVLDKTMGYVCIAETPQEAMNFPLVTPFPTGANISCSKIGVADSNMAKGIVLTDVFES